ncbi:hypothetical protein D0812_05295 [Vibrio owensii]|uniref:DNA helicase n=1 Tax=Vibrio owensii TaxID=696485 RepID=A0AAP9GAZ2_9VIBR|nr:hypothetical protein [Vibrio owensii]AYO13862.1 hypothetical protein D0812_05295 [Vibrio owensii]QGH46537.1 hypothetical protein APZ19_05205 [Vibrio owensii]
MNQFYEKISGCIRYSDYVDAANWLNIAKEALDNDSYTILLRKVIDKHPHIANDPNFSHHEMFGTKYTYKSEYITQLKTLLAKGASSEAEKLYHEHLSFEDYPTFFKDLEQSKKIARINAIKSKTKKTLSKIEGELVLDVDTHLNYEDKPYFRRVETSKANFYVTRSSNYELSTFSLKNKFARHLPWNHPLARNVLSTEINQKSEHGSVSLIGNYEPDQHNLKNITYLTAQGRHYFEDAVQSLTTNDKTSSDSGKPIDVDNFMNMKEVIPTASQMKAIYALGNHIIDGPAGTGKSTSILQKILVLVNDEKLSPEQIIVMVKHSGLVTPFEGLLSQMGISGVNIIAVSEFLGTQLGGNYSNLTVGKIDDLVSASETIRQFLNKIAPQEARTHVETLPNCLNETVLFELLKNHNAIQFELEHLKAKKEKRERILQQPLEAKFADLVAAYKDELFSLDSRSTLRKGLFIDSDDLSKLENEEKKYRSLIELRTLSDEDERGQYDSLVTNVVNKVLELEQRILGRRVKNEKPIALAILIEKRITDKLEAYKKSKQAEIDMQRRDAINNDPELIQSTNSLKSSEARLNASYQEIETAALNNVIGFKDAESKQLLKVLTLRKMKLLDTIIIDEAQDVPPVDIELVGFFTQRLILSGDEAQNENPYGIGVWRNLRQRTGFYTNEKLTLYKLKHNFRQTYELGNLSYNFRQLMLGLEIEDLEEEYFENQKGFEKPIIKRSELKVEIDEKLKFIKSSFTKKLPLVVIFDKPNDPLQKSLVYDLIVSGLSVSVGEVKAHNDVSFLLADQVAGKEFPVVIAVTSEQTEDGTLYIMLSRAKFNLTIMVEAQSEVNDKLKALAANDIVSLI